jgi:hypothetical protein
VTGPVVLDWRRAQVGPLAPCVLCGELALCRHPHTGQPCHKGCAELAACDTAEAATLDNADPEPLAPELGDAADSSLLAAGRAYIGRGWPVFVLGRSKRPVANCVACRDPGPGHDRDRCGCLTCHGFYAATSSPARLAAMLAAVPGGLLAIRTGTASGLLVVDIDPRNGGQLDPGLMSPTAAVATGGGGWHLYYRHPARPVTAALPGRPGVDIKADGGYTVAPPSVHPGTGQPYRWANQRPVAEMAPALLSAVTASLAAFPPSQPGPGAPRRAGAISSPSALLAAHLAAVARAPEGRRRVTLYGAARGVARMVAAGAISEQHAREVLTAAGTAAQQTPGQIRAAIDGAFRDEGAAA